jgi:hypothetical protein
MSDILRVFGVSRLADNDKAVLISFSEPLTDDQLRHLHEYLREWTGPFDFGALQRLRKISP